MTRLYEAVHKQWDHTGYNVPEPEHSESQYPAAELKPADWLPVGRYDKKFEVYAVCAAGKVVAVDREGRAVPAGLKRTFEAAGGSTILTYVAADVTEGTIDLTTGVAVTSATTYDQTAVTAALRLLGLITASETARDFISWPIGYAPYTYFQWAGGDGWNPAQYRQHNHNLQHQVACGTDKILQVPMVPAVVTTETMGDGSIQSTALTFGTTQWIDSTGLGLTTRYSSLVSAGDDVVACVLATYPVATITDETPIVDSGSALAAKTETTSIAAVAAGGSGYFYIDYEAGVLFVYESGGDAVPAEFTDGATTITYYGYETSATGTDDIVQVIGDVKVGDFVTFDDLSNYVRWAPDIGTTFGGSSGDAFSADPDYDSSSDATISAQLEAFAVENQCGVVGQVIAIWTWPRSGLEKVMTQYRSLTRFEEMPGTATGGRSDALVQASGADKVAVINFLSR